jgi:NADPH2:quinone reductase
MAAAGAAAWLCETLDGADALRWQDLPTPEPKPGEVRIAIKAASLNFPDMLIVQGKYQFKPALPFVPGSRVRGRGRRRGRRRDHLKCRRPVAAIGGTGGFGTHACVPTPAACCRCRRALQLETAPPLPSPTAPRTTR